METEYSAEDIVAYHDVLAIQNSEHHRLKMVTIGRRSKDANKGRSLGKGYYLRLDEVENPIIEFRSAPQSSSHFLAKLIVGGMVYRSKPSYYRREDEQYLSMFLRKYTDYVSDGKSFLPRNADGLAKKELGYGSHEVPWKTPECDCYDCKTLFDPWLEKAKKMNEIRGLYIAGLKLVPNENEEVFIPYSEEAEDITFLPSSIETEWQKVKKARDWKRKEKIEE